MKQDERDEYFYSLGHVTAIAEIYTLLEITEEESKYQKVMEWARLMKDMYEETDLWQHATKQIKKQNRGENKCTKSK